MSNTTLALRNRSAFRDALVDWFHLNAKDYPWRRTTDPYAILVSEMMLQQTQVATVLDRGYYTRWLERFPTVHELAAADESTVLSLWEGLGYYNRARNLQKAAQAIVHDHGGQFPEALDTILDLPGIGRYTAGAVYSFAYDRPAPVVDANGIRVITRLTHFEGLSDNAAGQNFIWSTAGRLVDTDRPRAFNSALMELGQRICTPKSPACKDCPVGEWCATYQFGHDPEPLPHKKPRRATVELAEHAVFAIDRQHEAILLHHEQGSRRKGLWKLPLRPVEDFGSASPCYEARYAITHHRVQLAVYEMSAAEIAQAEGDRWIAWENLADLPMAAPFRKAVNALMKEVRTPSSNLTG
ncbi:A/G-specific adenine glycosylase [Sulfuriroseicoccus oceanibius]|uniref:Adenine DNA glycosylase n=1 Tax=Sulfuriroseicoccus oceanibius TaxID=2707525 RepID=A0A6B3LAJ8_9BACT|nr:A/G-specific adenine glycosylase [Sulfuriroseicoccus oceanibius]QQL45493.1 A/G-specific adenine glycosylase [Sulfuriroseicoccus oceanibius]